MGIFVNQSKVLLGKRPLNRPWHGWWEFPGGKVDNQETFENALKREIKEELAINIRIIHHIASKKHKDDKIDVNVHYYLCESLNEKITLSEHEDMKWLQKNNLNKFKMAPGDSKIIKYLL